MQNKQTKKHKARSSQFFFLWSTSLVSANPCLNVHQHSKCNQSIMAKHNRTTIKGINPQKIVSEPVSGPTFQQWNHHFKRTVLPLPVTPQAHCGNVLQRCPSFYWEQFHQVSKQDWVFHFLAQAWSPQLYRAAHIQVSLIQCWAGSSWDQAEKCLL